MQWNDLSSGQHIEFRLDDVTRQVCAMERLEKAILRAFDMYLKYIVWQHIEFGLDDVTSQGNDVHYVCDIPL